MFERLATGQHIPKLRTQRDPAFDLRNESIDSFAANVTKLLQWRSYDSYIKDMRSLLQR